jgi:hypothetical protein
MLGIPQSSAQSTFSTQMFNAIAKKRRGDWHGNFVIGIHELNHPWNHRGAGPQGFPFRQPPSLFPGDGPCFQQAAMTINEQKEQFSFAYVRAICASANIIVNRPTVDQDSIDLAFQQDCCSGPIRSPRLEAQVKCTESTQGTDSHISYPLELKI